MTQKELDAFEEVMGFKLANSPEEARLNSINNQIDNLTYLIANAPKTDAAKKLILENWQVKLDDLIKRKQLEFPNIVRLK